MKNMIGQKLISKFYFIINIIVISTVHFGNHLFTILKILKWNVGGTLFTENQSDHIGHFHHKIRGKVAFD